MTALLARVVLLRGHHGRVVHRVVPGRPARAKDLSTFPVCGSVRPLSSQRR
ncbi:hypothetical protein [Phycicoccus sp. 3266]|uniref:hypothetical protein n=1 Tax=Phycicoccus sp. 3266 TaxID=2817751 RepID=UPI0028616AD6|nr:hypothetical protein [Phycicoccus sp. 3266]MDR6863425.1 hypothetical protein [Phycicoccus sp. 3266]